jgi:hypothetical protein
LGKYVRDNGDSAAGPQHKKINYERLFWQIRRDVTFGYQFSN